MYPQTLNAPSPSSGGQSPILSDANLPNAAISTSAYCFKGNILVPSVDLKIYAVRSIFIPLSSAVYQAIIAPLNGTGATPSISGTPNASDTETMPTFPASQPGNVRCKFSSPVTLTAGTAYAILMGRIDSTTTYVMPMSSGAGTVLPWIKGQWTYQARIASLAPANGNSIDTNSSAAPNFNLGLEWLPA